MTRLGAVSGAVLLAQLCGCSLVIDTDAVRARRDAGVTTAPDAGPDAGPERAPDAASAEDATVTVDASNDADAASAPDATAAPDAAAPSPCARDSATLLTCTAPIPLVRQGRDLAQVSIAGLSTGFVAAVAEGATITTRTLDLTGRVLTTRTVTSPARPTGLQVAASGDRWALAYTPGLGRQVMCLSSESTRTTTIATPPLVDDVAVAVGPTGLVAIGAIELNSFSTQLTRAISAAPGCPTTSADMQPAYYTRGVAALHVPGGAPADFRFGVTAVHPNLVDSVIAEVSATGSQFNYLVYGGLGVRTLEVAPTSSGVHMAVAYGWVDETSGDHGLWGGVHRTDFGGAPDTERAIAPSVGAFDFAACGPGCLVAAYLVDEGRGRLSATFLADEVGLGVRGATDEHDAACMIGVTGAEVDVAYSSGKLAFLYTQGTRADLYLCDVPPL